MADVPLDSSSHEAYLESIIDSLRQILVEIQKLRGDVQDLTREVGSLDRG